MLLKREIWWENCRVVGMGGIVEWESWKVVESRRVVEWESWKVESESCRIGDL